MKNKIYFIEGIPGAGKTTLSKNLYAELRCRKEKVKIYRDCEKNPLDLARYAWMTMQEYGDILEGIDSFEIKSEINSLVEIQGNKVLIPYMSLTRSCVTKDLAKKMSSFDVYNGHLSFENFRNLHLKKWKKFADYMKNSDEIVIFEGVLFQSPLFELIGYFDLNIDTTIAYIADLLETLKAYKTILYYIDVNDVNKILYNICSERVTASGQGHWEQGALRWIHSSPYCQKRNYKGYTGMVKFFEYRKQVDEILIKKLPIQTIKFQRNI